MKSEVRIPRRMRDLPRDSRGYPIPVTVYRDREGRPHFTINEEGSRAFAIHEGTCSICGQPLLRERWFVGGPESAFHEFGAYADPPMHRECAHYALRVCPYLAAPNYSGLVGDRTLRGPLEPGRILMDTTQDPDRPPLFVLVGSTATLLAGKPEERGPGMISPYVRPRRPYVDIEFWRSGQQLRSAIGLRELSPEQRAQVRKLLDHRPRSRVG